ncbi:MAG: tetratricopeptide repeat protein [Melioribacteraceae bacterium]
MKNTKIVLLIILSIFLSFCGGKSETDLFDEATKQLVGQDYSKAVMLFEQLVEEFPKGEKASHSLFELAKLYQGQVVKNLDPTESLKKSVKLYKKIYTEYPKSTKAENAMFMASFILANDIRDYDDAKISYELYLEKYPNGLLAKDAKIELQNLGKTPEEVLKEKLQSETDN